MIINLTNTKKNRSAAKLRRYRVIVNVKNISCTKSYSKWKGKATSTSTSCASSNAVEHLRVYTKYRGHQRLTVKAKHSNIIVLKLVRRRFNRRKRDQWKITSLSKGLKKIKTWTKG